MLLINLIICDLELQVDISRYLLQDKYDMFGEQVTKWGSEWGSYLFLGRCRGLEISFRIFMRHLLFRVTNRHPRVLVARQVR